MRPFPVVYPQSRRRDRLRRQLWHRACGVYRDPQTGRLGPPPAGLVPLGLTTAEQRMLNRSDQGLQSRTLSGGGVAVDLQGRYRSMAVATVGADGQAAVNCELTPAQVAAALRAGQQAKTGSAD